jgi:hypothetical protein
MAAEKAGAKLAIIINTEDKLMPMGDDQRNHPAIPSIHLPLSAGQALREALAGSAGGLLGTLRPASAQPTNSAAHLAAAAAAGECPAPGSAGPDGLQQQALLESPGAAACGSSSEGDAAQDPEVPGTAFCTSRVPGVAGKEDLLTGPGCEPGEVDSSRCTEAGILISGGQLEEAGQCEGVREPASAEGCSPDAQCDLGDARLQGSSAGQRGTSSAFPCLNLLIVSNLGLRAVGAHAKSPPVSRGVYVPGRV